MYKKIVFIILFCPFSMQCYGQQLEAYNKLKTFLDDFYGINVHNSIIKYGTSNTINTFLKYDRNIFYDGEERMYKCKHKYLYDIIYQDNKSENVRFSFDILLNEDTIRNLLIVKENDEYKIELSHPYLMKLLLNEKEIYVKILNKLFYLRRGILSELSESEKFQMCDLWYNEQFYKSYNDSLVDYLYGTFILDKFYYEIERADNEIDYAKAKSLLPKAKFYFMQAFERGYHELLLELSQVASMMEDRNFYYAFCKKGAEKNIPAAMYHYGKQWLNEYYSEDRQTRINSENTKQAIYWLKKAAEQGYEEAKLSLSDIYKHGLGVPKNIEEAEKWYNSVDKKYFLPKN